MEHKFTIECERPLVRGRAPKVQIVRIWVERAVLEANEQAQGMI